MLVVMNIRDAKATEWDRFWIGVLDDESVPLKRFGFRMWVLDVRKDMPRIEARCKEQMRWAKSIIQAEEKDARRIAYQQMHDCKSHRAMVGAYKSLDLVNKTMKEIMDAMTL